MIGLGSDKNTKKGATSYLSLRTNEAQLSHHLDLGRPNCVSESVAKLIKKWSDLLLACFVQSDVCIRQNKY